MRKKRNAIARELFLRDNPYRPKVRSNRKKYNRKRKEKTPDESGVFI